MCHRWYYSTITASLQFNDNMQHGQGFGTRDKDMDNEHGQRHGQGKKTWTRNMDKDMDKGQRHGHGTNAKTEIWDRVKAEEVQAERDYFEFLHWRYHVHELG